MKHVGNVFLVGFLFFIIVAQTFAQESSTTSSLMSVTPTPQVSSYQLPYPGLLPNNPFYGVKAARDRIVSFLISDPIKKAHFDILQADKRLSAAISVFRQGDQALAETTIAKGENYFDDAFIRIGEAKQQGMDITEVVHKLSLSLHKHKEVLVDLQKKAKTKNIKGKIGNQIDKVSAFEKRLALYMPEKK